MWFICEAGKTFIAPRKYSTFYANIQRDSRVAITIDEEAGRYRKVLVKGKQRFSTSRVRMTLRDTYRCISRRYIDDQSVHYYITETIDQPRALIGVELTKAKVTTWRMPKKAKRTPVFGTRVLRIGLEDEKTGGDWWCRGKWE